MKTTGATFALASLFKECLANQLTHHPARCAEILHVMSKYQVYHTLMQLGMLHQQGFAKLSAASLHEHRQYAEQLTRAFEELGACFIKLGQLLSTRPDLLPEPYISSLTRLQSMVAPVPGWQIVQLIEEDLHAPLPEIFVSFDLQPLATASIAQIHKATLPDGSQVVVKVQRPGVQQQVEVDIAVLHDLVRFITKHTPFGARFGFLPIVQEFKRSLYQELDFLQEANNTQNIGHDIREFHSLVTPRIYSLYSSRRVLTLSFIPGKHLKQLSANDLGRCKPTEIAKELLSAYLKQILVSGIFHCDPHPGNMLLADDGRLALLDFGMIGRLDTRQMECIILLLLAFAQRQGERVADRYLELIAPPNHFDRRAFTREICGLVCRYNDLSAKNVEIGKAMLDLVAIASAHHLAIPASFALLGKTLLNLDGALRILSPDLDLLQAVHHDMRQIIQQRTLAQLSPTKSIAWLLDSKHLIENMLRKSDLLLDKLTDERNASSAQMERLHETITRASRRLSFGMIFSSLALSLALFFGLKRARK